MDSECSSGCDSGWTLYFDQSYISTDSSYERDNRCVDWKNVSKFEGDEEDLSMVSDASSGPPHFQEENMDDATTLVKKSAKKQKSRVSKKQQREEVIREKRQSLLDDTASSPAFNFSKNNYVYNNNNQVSMESGIMDFSLGFSATHYEGESAFQSNFGILQSSLSANQLHQNQWFGENRLGMR